MCLLNNGDIIVQRCQALRRTRSLIDDLAQDFRNQAAFAARARFILQRLKPTSEIQPSPLGDLVTVHADPPANDLRSVALTSSILDMPHSFWGGGRV